MIAESDTIAYKLWAPRPDQPERYDEQESFYNSDLPGVAFLIGGNGAGCLSADQKIYDPHAGLSRKVSEINGEFHVWARNQHGQAVVAKAMPPRVYGVEDLYDVALSNGQVITVTLGHRLLTESGWREIGDIARDAGLLPRRASDADQLSQAMSVASKPSSRHTSEVRPSGEETARPCAIARSENEATLSTNRSHSSEQRGHDLGHASDRATVCPCESRRCDAHSFRTPSDSRDRCSTDRHQCGEQLQSESKSGQEPSQLSSDVREHIRSNMPSDDRAGKPACSHPCPRGDRPSMHDCGNQGHHGHEDQCVSSGFCSQSSDRADTQLESFPANMVATNQMTADQQSLGLCCRSDTTQSCVQAATVSRLDEPCLSPLVGTGENATYITAITFVRRDSYWDFHVPVHENYWMEGIWHHNTTECSCAKVAKFVLFDQPPPRPDTPFYIIASSYEQAMKVCWKDKMLGHGHIPRGEVDWERVSWYSVNDGWPYRVPLKPWPGHRGKNWVLEFKSYEQGQAQFMADSIGGFMFSEQFPWGLLEEVLRGCREYNFHGAKICEFTPVDPMLSSQLEEMIDQDRLPPGWEVFRANTEVAMEAGHVSAEWYQEFFGLISDEMADVRKIGAFGSYKGRVYPTFSKIHYTDEPLEELLAPGMQHRRGLDWGFGEDNAFCCVFGAKRGDGSWLIYDEYYSTDQTRTIHDHLREIADMWDWPKGNPEYGMTYADPSDPGNIRLASKFSHYEPDYENFNIQAASNRVFEGIEYVRWLLKPNANGKPRLVIHRPSCPKLIQQMKTYRFRQGTDTGRNPTDARPEILKKNDHAVDALRYLVFSDANSTGNTAEGVRREKNYRRYGVLGGRQ